jgi:hypothetical protein
MNYGAECAWDCCRDSTADVVLMFGLMRLLRKLAAGDGGEEL